MLTEYPTPLFMPAAPRIPGGWAHATLSVSYESISGWIFCLLFFFFKQSNAYFTLISELNLFLFIAVSDVLYLNLTIFLLTPFPLS